MTAQERYEEITYELEQTLRQIGQYQGRNKEYFNSQSIRYRELLSILSERLDIDEVLEVGSAPFQFSYCLSKAGYDVTAIDLKPQKFTSLINMTDVQAIQADIEADSIPISSSSFNAIIFAEVFEHLRMNPIHTVEELFRVLKPGGRLVLTTPNLYWLNNIIEYMKGSGSTVRSIYSEYAKLDDIGYVGHVREYAPSEITDFLEEIGFTIDHVGYSMFNDDSAPFFLKRLIYRLIPQLRHYQYIIATK